MSITPVCYDRHQKQILPVEIPTMQEMPHTGIA
jgi:hypothetical protein